MPGVNRQLRELSVTAVVSAACNLRCRYCYQNRRTSQRMSWAVLRTAIDYVLGGAAARRSVLFTGGEPLLAFPLIEKAVAYVERRAPSGRPVTYDLTTNGTLVRRPHLAFFAEKGFTLQLSFDGVPEAQAVRGRGTFARLDSLLDLIRSTEPDFYTRSLRVSVTVNREALRWLADSVDYLLAKGVRDVSLTPDLRPIQWTASDVKTLDRQFGRIFASSLRRYRRTGDVPLLLFRKNLDNGEYASRRGPVCGAASGRRITVDVDGQVYACPMLVESTQVFPDTPLGARLSAMRLGDIRDDRFQARLRGLAPAARRTGIFYRRADKFSSYGRCGRCRFIDSCTPCPVPVARDAAHEDPNRVPDHLCAFNRIALSYRARFPRQVTPLDVIAGRASLRSYLAGVRS